MMMLRIVIICVLTCLPGCCAAPRSASPVWVGEGVGAGWPGAWWVPMALDPLPHVPILLRRGAGTPAVVIEACVDTGSVGGIILPPLLAESLGVRPTGPPRRARGVAGPVEFIPAGEVDVEIAGVRLVGVSAEIGPTETVNIGAECLSRAGGFVFDWAGERMGVVPRQRERARPAGWIAAPVFPSAPESAPGLGLEFRIRQLFTRATLDGRSVLAALDTGGTGDLAVPGEASGPREAVRVLWFGNETSGQRSRRPVTLVIGGFLAFEVRPIWVGKRAAWTADVVVGLGVLGRQPLWVDYDAAEVRFWGGDRAVGK